MAVMPQRASRDLSIEAARRQSEALAEPQHQILRQFSELAELQEFARQMYMATRWTGHAARNIEESRTAAMEREEAVQTPELLASRAPGRRPGSFKLKHAFG